MFPNSQLLYFKQISNLVSPTIPIHSFISTTQATIISYKTMTLTHASTHSCELTYIIQSCPFSSQNVPQRPQFHFSHIVSQIQYYQHPSPSGTLKPSGDTLEFWKFQKFPYLHGTLNLLERNSII